MTGSQAGTERRRTHRRHRIASIAGLVALLGALLVTVAAPAHAALSPCTASDPYCPFGVTDNYTVNFGQKLIVDAAHGLLANDRAPAGTRIEFGGCTDTSSFWTDASFAVQSNGAFTYTPAPNEPYSGMDTLEYCIVDPAGDDDFGIDVNIKVIATARNDSYGARVNTPLNVSTPGLVADDSGIDPASLTLDTASAHGGTVTDNLNGAFLYTPATNFQGTDTFGYTGSDLDADFDYSATVTIYVDGTAPVATMSAPGLVTLNTKVPAAWSATDPGGATASGIASYDEQYKIAPWNGPFGAFSPLKTTVAKSDTIAGTFGRTFCFHVRAKDRAGNYSPFTALRCTSVPLRARSLSYTAKWNRSSNPAYFSGEAYVTTTKGQNASLPAVQAQRMWLVATKCATCGTVQVRWNNVIIANVNLASPATVRHALFPIAAFPTPKAGSLRLYVTSPNGKGVIIEGLAVLRA